MKRFPEGGPLDEAGKKRVETLRQHLHQLSFNSREARFQHRLHCVLLMAEGFPVSQISKLYNESERSLDRWWQRYVEQGVDGLRSELQSGRPSRITPEQFQALADLLQDPPIKHGFEQAHWQGRHLQEILKERYNTRLGLRQCQRLLTRLREHLDNEPVHVE